MTMPVKKGISKIALCFSVITIIFGLIVLIGLFLHTFVSDELLNDEEFSQFNSDQALTSSETGISLTEIVEEEFEELCEENPTFAPILRLFSNASFMIWRTLTKPVYYLIDQINQ
jgi:hypothetical protein